MTYKPDINDCITRLFRVGNAWINLDEVTHVLTRKIPIVLTNDVATDVIVSFRYGTTLVLVGDDASAAMAFFRLEADR